MKHISIVDVKTGDPLKVKIFTLVITYCEASLNSKGKIEEERASSDHFTVQEADDLEAKVESVEAAATSEDGKGF